MYVTDSLPLTLREREEYLTWSVANARGHAGSPYGHTESAVGFLTDVEEKLEVAKVQRELLDEVEQLMVRLQDTGVDLNTQSGWGGYERLQNGLLSVSEVRGLVRTMLRSDVDPICRCTRITRNHW
jgi:hypothetical protein